MESIKEYRIILASASPRRLEIMGLLGLEVEVAPSGVNEEVDITNPPAIVEELSQRKAKAACDDLAASEPITDPVLVIGADTVVSIDGDVLGKPVDKEDACRMLHLLSGRVHEVYTGVTLIVINDGERRIKTFNERTLVKICPMTDEEIDEYIATGDPLDKAGAYGVQSGAACFVSGIDGDFYNVMGLPASRLYHEIRNITGCTMK